MLREVFDDNLVVEQLRCPNCKSGLKESPFWKNISGGIQLQYTHICDNCGKKYLDDDHTKKLMGLN